MNRNAVKTFAQWGRKHLHELVRARLALFGVTERGIETPRRIEGGMIVGSQTLTLSSTDLGQYDALITHYHDLNGTAREKFDLLADEIAYTWFNRLAALRFMEVHGYVERALSSDTPGVSEPNLMRDAMTLAAADDLPGVTPDTLTEWQRLYQPGEVYRRLLVAQAAAFQTSMPFLFGRDKAWLDLFLPDTLLNQDSIVRRMVNDIPEDDWNDIEIVGWLYQFYISERKDEVFAQKGKYSPRDIPAATQLFTPHWIVRYMVENSLGRVWLEAHPESTLREHMPYYLESENPAPPPNPDLTPESLTVMDPACGSGHILVYAFDLLAHIYRERGYTDRDIPALILEHNLHGLDIDERAAQLASLAVVMKARELNSRLFRRDMPEPNILQMRSTRHLRLPNTGSRDMLGNYSILSGGLGDADAFNPNDWQPLVDAFADADHLGSLISPPAFNAERLRAQLRWVDEKGGFDGGALEELQYLVKQAELLGRSYESVVANPPYLSNTSYSQTLKSFVEKFFPLSKADLYTVFMERALALTSNKKYYSMVNQHSWMFLGVFGGLRKHILEKTSIINLIHLGSRAFPEIIGEVVQSVAFVIRNERDKTYSARYIRLLDYTDSEKKEKAYTTRSGEEYLIKQSMFSSLDGSQFIYWASERIIDILKSFSKLSDISSVVVGTQTGSNDMFIRDWHEVNSLKIASKESLKKAKWYFHQKGGEYRKWYGNNDLIIEWENDGERIKTVVNWSDGKYTSYPRNLNFNLREGITWTVMSSRGAGFRKYDSTNVIGHKGPGVFSDFPSSILGLLNSPVSQKFLDLASSNLGIEIGHVSNIPVQLDKEDVKIETLIKTLIAGYRSDWDNFETSWNFITHVLLRPVVATVSEAFSSWQAQAEVAFRELQRLEEENNRYWIDAYGLQDELTPDVPDDQITIRRADLGRDVRSLLSYAVGCMMGRYSLDQPGLIHAGQPFDPSRHQTFPADRDGILPVTLDSYFEDDVTSRFVEFLRVAFAPEKVAENLEWVAAALGGVKAGESAEARIRRYFATEFMSDHIQTYKKRPIYWLFTSGKKRGFGALVYLHRYDEGTLARLRTDYLMPLQRTLDAELERATGEAETAGSTAAKKTAEKRMKDLKEQIAEVHRYDESLKHAADLRISLDLDDGVAYNYWLMGAAGLQYRTGHEVKGLQDLVYTGTDLKLTDMEKKSQWKRDLLEQERAQRGGNTSGRLLADGAS